MAREYFCAYHSLLESLTPYGDAECGRLFRAALEYSATGRAEEFRGNERFIWPTLKQMIDRDKDSYKATCDANRENGAKGGRPKKTKNRPVFSETEKSQEEEKEKEKGEEEEKEEMITPPTPPAPAPAKHPAIEYFFDRINPTPSPVLTQALIEFVDELGDDVVLHALHIAVDERKTAWSYIRAILTRYKAEGLRDLQAVMDAEQTHQHRKMPRAVDYMTPETMPTPEDDKTMEQLDRLMERMKGGGADDG